MPFVIGIGLAARLVASPGVLAVEVVGWRRVTWPWPH
jgi:hypothetical protein